MTFFLGAVSVIVAIVAALILLVVWAASQLPIYD